MLACLPARRLGKGLWGRAPLQHSTTHPRLPNTQMSRTPQKLLRCFVPRMHNMLSFMNEWFIANLWTRAENTKTEGW